MSRWVLAHKKSSMSICWMNKWGSLKHHLLYEAFQDQPRSQKCILCATFHRIVSELTCSTANYFSLGNTLTHFCDFHFILPNVFLSSPFYLKSEAVSYEQQVLICVDILFVDWGWYWYTWNEVSVCSYVASWEASWKECHFILEVCVLNLLKVW